MSKPVYLSYSGASSFKACPEKFYLSKEYKERGNFSYFVFGSSVENGITAALETRDLKIAQKAWRDSWEAKSIFDNMSIEYGKNDVEIEVIEPKESMIVAWMQELFGDDETRKWTDIFFDLLERRKKDKKWSTKELKFYNRLAWLTHMVKGDIFVLQFFNEVLPEIKGLVTIDGKLGSQLAISIGSDDGDKITGYIDYVVELNDGTILVLDCKTAASAYEDHKLLTSEQLKTYASWLSTKIEGKIEIGYLVFVKKLMVEKACGACGHIREESKLRNCTSCKKGKYDQASYSAHVQFTRREIDEAEMDYQMEDYTNVAAAVKAGIRYKNPENCFSFGRRCQFYDACHNGVPLDELTTVEPKAKK